MEASASPRRRSGTAVGVAPRGPDGMLQPRVKEMWVKFFVRSVSFFQWAGDSIGVVLFFWTGAVVVGAFCSNLVPEDFWSATLIIFVEAFRSFNRKRKIGRTSWFDSKNAIRHISFPLGHELQAQHRQDFNTMLLIATLFVNGMGNCPVTALVGMITAILISLLNNLKFPWEIILRCYKWFVLWGLLFGVAAVSGVKAYRLWKDGDRVFVGLTLAAVLQQVIAVSLMNSCPQVDPRNGPFLCKLLCLAKITSVICLYLGDPLTLFLLHGAFFIKVLSYLGMPFAMLVLSTCSLQPLDTLHHSWLDLIFKICLTIKCLSRIFILNSGITFVALFVITLIGNLQIPTSVACIVVSLWRLRGQASAYKNSGIPNLESALKIFYYFVLSQAISYICACLGDASLMFLRKSRKNSPLCVGSTEPQLQVIVHNTDDPQLPENQSQMMQMTVQQEQNTMHEVTVTTAQTEPVGSMSGDRWMAEHFGALASEVESKIYCHGDALAEYQNIRNVIDGVAEEKERLQQEKKRFKQDKKRLKQEKEIIQSELHANGEALEAMKKDLLASRNTLIAASNVITSSTEKISRQEKEMEVLKKKLEESEAKNNRAEQECENSPALIQSKRVQTRSMDKRKRSSEGSLDYGAYENEYTSQLDDQSLSHLAARHHNVQTTLMELSEEDVGNELVNKSSVVQTSGILASNKELESIRNDLIKGFLVIDTGGRKLGIREMGELNEKAFKTACLQKLPPEEAGTACYQLYSSWQKQLGDLSWYPFKTVTVDGNSQEIVNFEDDKLQELKRTWGEVAYDAVIRALVEMQEYNHLSDRSIAYELWNYKEGREATIKEGVEYMCSQVKQLSATKRRKTRRTAGIA